jgi:flavin-dependent dehydrogenase
MTTDVDVDVVVLGAGLAGMAAATSSATAGARTLVLERADTIGGSAAISGGYVWAIEDLDALRVEDPGRFQRHGHLVVDGYQDAIDWLRGYVPPLTDEQPALAGRGYKFDMPLVIAHLVRGFCAVGGRLIPQAQTDEVVRVDDRYRLSVTTPTGSIGLTSRPTRRCGPAWSAAGSSRRCAATPGRRVPAPRSPRAWALA